MKTERFELKISKADKLALKAAGVSMGSYILGAALGMAERHRRRYGL